MREDESRPSTHRRRFAWLAVIACIAAALLVIGCGDDDEGSTGASGSTSTGTTTQAQKDLKLGAALLGPKNDKSINQAGFLGIQAADKALDNVKVSAVLDNQATTQKQANSVQTLAPNNDIVYVLSNAFSPVIDIQADRFPKTKFIGMEAYTKKFHENVYAAAVDWGASSYVAGVIAGKMTKSNVIGFIGGAEIPPTVQSQNAYIDGAKSVNPKVKVLTNITGNFADVALGKQATAAMLQQKADVILPWLDAGVVGAYQAAKESGTNPAMFKLTIPDCEAYGNIVGTEVVNTVQITKKLIANVANGTAKPGAAFIGLKDPDLQTLALCPKYEKNTEIADLTKQTIDDINSGKIKLKKNALNPRPSYDYTEGLSE
jgi:basic membrane protein A and related proteins